MSTDFILSNGLPICNLIIWLFCWQIARNLYIEYKLGRLQSSWIALGLIYAMFVGGFEFLGLLLWQIFHSNLSLYLLLLVGIIGVFNLTTILIMQYLSKYRNQKQIGR